MRISDWSSDVCSSDLEWRAMKPWVSSSRAGWAWKRSRKPSAGSRRHETDSRVDQAFWFGSAIASSQDRKSVVWGKSVAVRVDLGGRRILKKKNAKEKQKETEEYNVDKISKRNT